MNIHTRMCLSVYCDAIHMIILHSNSNFSLQFCAKFPDQSLADVLSNFSLPTSLGEIKEIIEDEV